VDSKPSAADQMYRQISDESKVGQILSTENLLFGISTEHSLPHHIDYRDTGGEISQM